MTKKSKKLNTRELGEVVVSVSKVRKAGLHLMLHEYNIEGRDENVVALKDVNLDDHSPFPAIRR